MPRVLLTGASGFIGRHCAARLESGGWTVHGVSSRCRESEGGSLRWHRADLLEASEVARLMEEVRPEALLHLAWHMERGSTAGSPENYRWVRAGLELLREFAARGGRRVVVTGSCAEYDWRYGFCSEELTPLASATVYGRCKRAYGELFTGFCNLAGLQGSWARVFHLYGPGEHPERLVSSVIRAVLAGRPAACSTGEEIRDYLYVEDVADALVALLESGHRGVVNVASGEPVKVATLARSAARAAGDEGLLELGVRPSSEGTPLLVGDVRRLRATLDWRPACDLEAGLTRSVEWWRGQEEEASP